MSTVFLGVGWVLDSDYLGIPPPTRTGPCRLGPGFRIPSRVPPLLVRHENISPENPFVRVSEGVHSSSTIYLSLYREWVRHLLRLEPPVSPHVRVHPGRRTGKVVRNFMTSYSRSPSSTPRTFPPQTPSPPSNPSSDLGRPGPVHDGTVGPLHHWTQPNPPTPPSSTRPCPTTHGGPFWVK